MKDLTNEDKKKGPSLYLRILRFVERIIKKKFLIKLSITIIILFVLFFPAETGEIIGSWYNKLIQAFIDSKDNI